MNQSRELPRYPAQEQDIRIPDDLIAQFERAEPIFISPDSTAAEITQAALLLLEQSKSTVGQCCRHPLCARMLEDCVQHLYQVGNDGPIVSLLRDLSPLVLRLAQHPSGSHVIQTVLVLVSRVARDDPSVQAIFDEVVYEKMLADTNVADVFESQYATQILKSLIRTESGNTPEEGRKRGHAYHQLMSEQLYGLADKFHWVKTDKFSLLMKRTFKQLKAIGFMKVMQIPDTSSLCATYCQHAEDMDELYHPVVIICSYFNVEPQQYYVEIQRLKSTKSLVDEDKFPEITAKFQGAFDHFKKCEPAQHCFEQMLQLESMQLFASCCLQALQQWGFESYAKGQYQFLYQKCLLNIYLCPKVLLANMDLVASKLDYLFELEQQQIIANILPSSRKFESRFYSTKIVTDETLKAEFFTKIANLFNQIAAQTNSERFFVRRLIFPNLDDTEPLQLENLFDRTKRFQFDSLNVQVDKDKTSKEDFTKLMDAKRKEHEQLQLTHRELKFGAGSRQATERGVWQVGQQILVQMLMFTNLKYTSGLLKSFQASFLDTSVKSTAQVASDLEQLVKHPGGNDVLAALCGNTFIPVHYKLLILNSLRGRLDALANTRLGRQLLTSIVNQVKSRVQTPVPSLGIVMAPADVNLSAVTMTAEELGSVRRLRSLQRSKDGEELIKALALDQYLTNKTVWLQDQRARLARVWKRAETAGKGADVV